MRKFGNTELKVYFSEITTIKSEGKAEQKIFHKVPMEEGNINIFSIDT